MSSLRNGMLKNCVFGTYRAPASKKFLYFSAFREPRNHLNCQFLSLNSNQQSIVTDG
jgi:hypothetical protein